MGAPSLPRKRWTGTHQGGFHLWRPSASVPDAGGGEQEAPHPGLRQKVGPLDGVPRGSEPGDRIPRQDDGETKEQDPRPTISSGVFPVGNQDLNDEEVILPAGAVQDAAASGSGGGLSSTGADEELEEEENPK